MARGNQSRASRRQQQHRGQRRADNCNLRSVISESPRSRQDRQYDGAFDPLGDHDKGGYGAYTKSPKKYVFVPRTENQRIMFAAIPAHFLTFATGVAGAGKTLVGIAAAHALFTSGQIEQIILTKPHFEVDEKLGTTPGDLQDKISHVVRPMRVEAEKVFGKSHLEYLINKEQVIFEYLGNIVGLTYDNAVVIMDEAQTASPLQMKALLTRTGKNTRYVICGDWREQKYDETKYGLEDAIARLGDHRRVAHIDFELEDCVRSEFCKDVIQAYRMDVTI